jgi:hypothetical protein
MKTTKLLSILGLIMIFSGAAKVYSDNVSANIPRMTTTNSIRYEVNVYFFSRIELCNTYLIQVTDETGRPVAPPKTFVPGIQRYIFTETGPAQGKIRVAMLVRIPDAAETSCRNQIGARDDVKLGPFTPGQSYPFLLRPFLTVPYVKE